jgi:choline kinase
LESDEEVGGGPAKRDGNEQNSGERMKSVLLAAGVGKRLGARGQQIPKGLLSFGGQSLLERHIRALLKFGARPVVIVIGYKKDDVRREITAKFCDRCIVTTNGKPAPADADIVFIENPVYHHGNLLSLWATHKLVETEPFLLMDADVLCDERLVQRILESPHANCFLLDRESVAQGGSDEEMVAGVNAGRVMRFERGLKARDFQVIGESVGFFKFSAEGSRAMFAKMKEYLDRQNVDAHYDDALGEILDTVNFGYEDITGQPWIEIDFEEDARRAEREILPRIVGETTRRRETVVRN